MSVESGAGKSGRHGGRRLGARTLGLALVLGAASAWAETTQCTVIASLPYTISVQGVYCLNSDLNTAMGSGSAIEIATNNVVLDLNGHKLGGLSAGPGTQATGIYALDHQNVTIRNGTVRGFYIGIGLTSSNVTYENSQGHLIEDVRADQNTYRGIMVGSRASTVQNCQVVATGGSTVFGPNAVATAILVLGPGNRVIDNDVATVTSQGSGNSYGIAISFADDAFVVNNRITESEFGILFSGSTGKYRDNITSTVTTPFTGGTNVGNNN